MDSAQILFLAVLYAIIRSTNVPTSKYLMKTVHPFMLSFMLGSLVFLILFATKRFKLKRFFAMASKEKIDYLKLLFLSSVGGMCLTLAIYYLSVKGFAVLISLLPIVVGVYSALLLGERPSKFLWFSALLAVIGSIVFKTGGAGVSFGLGDALVLVGVLLFALASINMRMFIKRMGRRELMIVSAGFGTVFSAVLAFFAGVLVFPEGTLMFWLLLLFNVLAVGVAANFIFAHLIKEAPAYLVTTVTTALVPLGASVLGVLFFGDTWSMQELIGAVFLIASAVISSWKKK